MVGAAVEGLLVLVRYRRAFAALKVRPQGVDRYVRDGEQVLRKKGHKLLGESVEVMLLMK